MSGNDNENFNADELQAPAWLNAEFLNEVLVKSEKDPELKVVEVKISPGSGKGDHYASVMFRAGVTYTTQKGEFHKSLIIKTMPEQEGQKKELLSESYLFETEIGMYSKVLPKFEEILRQAGDDTKLNAPCLYYSLKPHKMLIFEDLVPLGYAVVRDREPRIEEIHCALGKLAKWHAVSMKLQNEQVDFLSEFKYGLFETPNFMEAPFVKTGMTYFLQALDRVPELSKYKPYFEKIQHNYLEGVKAALSEYRENRQLDGYYGLSHGDFHLGNMMFKLHKQSGALEDIMLVDFQICNLCPITVDLIYATYMFMGPQQRYDDWEQVIGHYFTVLVETLKKIQFKGELPTLDGLWQQIHRHKFYDFFLVCSLLPMIWCLKSKAFDVKDMMENDAMRQKSYFVKEFLDDIKILLPKFEKLGYFDDI